MLTFPARFRRHDKGTLAHVVLGEKKKKEGNFKLFFFRIYRKVEKPSIGHPIQIDKAEKKKKILK
jgi:hypothetical protein